MFNSTLSYPQNYGHLRTSKVAPRGGVMSNRKIAADLLAEMKQLAGVKRLPQSPRGWWRLIRKVGDALNERVRVWPDLECSTTFQAALDRIEFVDGSSVWYVSYNPYSPSRWICRYLCHELMEFMAWHQFHGKLPASRAGTSETYDQRHQISLCAESITFRVPMCRVQDAPEPA